ncbi:pistil-specific extensin-like protein [Triticum aestivum]|uniref:pistil-specific extensin-like protein n=1 Tax=Triticum aestivum TaxID=4565 RepID=UPI00098B12FD|nr:pistil-specific extensin-like protein [Triticum aestivum]XP_045088640.1 pistil-specific extensin-like protein [Aegilops tauschii subsp. strangulata]
MAPHTAAALAGHTAASPQPLDLGCCSTPPPEALASSPAAAPPPSTEGPPPPDALPLEAPTSCPATALPPSTVALPTGGPFPHPSPSPALAARTLPLHPWPRRHLRSHAAPAPLFRPWPRDNRRRRGWPLIVPPLVNYFLYSQGFTQRGRMPAAAILDLKKLRQSYLFCTSSNELKIYGELFSNIWKILEQITTGGGHPGEHKTPGCAWAPRRALGVVPSSARLRYPSCGI